MSGKEISEEEIQRIEGFIERSRLGQPAMNYMLAAHDAVEDLCKETKRLAELEAESQRDRIWVSEDRKVLITMWASGKVTIALRSDPAWTWGPPETLSEEKT